MRPKPIAVAVRRALEQLGAEWAWAHPRRAIQAKRERSLGA